MIVSLAVWVEKENAHLAGEMGIVRVRVG
jgi:hypothetical protein